VRAQEDLTHLHKGRSDLALGSAADPTACSGRHRHGEPVHETVLHCLRIDDFEHSADWLKGNEP
jgi:hypothetical protein